MSKQRNEEWVTAMGAVVAIVTDLGPDAAKSEDTIRRAGQRGEFPVLRAGRITLLSRAGVVAWASSRVKEAVFQ